MTKLRFYDSELNPIMQTDKMISLNITRKYRGFGTVEIHFPITFGEVTDLIDRYQCLICVTDEVTAVITGWRLGEDIALFGRTAEWLLTKRFVPPFNLSATPVGLCLYAIAQGAGDFTKTEETEDTGETREYSFSDLTSVYDLVCSALEEQDLGFRLDADPGAKRLVLRIYQGEDRGLILSHSAATAHSIICVGDRLDMSTNSGWFQREVENAGKWNAYSNSPKLTDKSSDNCFKYYEVSKAGTQFYITFQEGQYIYCDSRDGVLKVSDSVPKPGWDYAENPSVTGIVRWDGILKETVTPEEATEALAKLGEKVKAEAELRHIQYQKDYGLGDRVRLQAESGDFKKTVHKMVTGVNIFYDTDGCGSCPIME